MRGGRSYKEQINTHETSRQGDERGRAFKLEVLLSLKQTEQETTEGSRFLSRTTYNPRDIYKQLTYFSAPLTLR